MARTGVEPSPWFSIQCYDVMSLYTFICKYFKFPPGHPKIQVGDACRDKQVMLSMEGLIKSTVLLPRRLYHPVLQFRCNNKLSFCLCKTCALECNFSGECVHERVEDRALCCTWVLDEIRQAIQKGYKAIDIFEVYEY